MRRSAQAIRKRLLAAGYPAPNVKLLGPRPELTSVVGRLCGRAGGKKPILPMAHLDVVAANRADWPTDPFTMVEKDG